MKRAECGLYAFPMRRGTAQALRPRWPWLLTHPAAASWNFCSAVGTEVMVRGCPSQMGTSWLRRFRDASLRAAEPTRSLRQLLAVAPFRHVGEVHASERLAP